MLKRDYEGNTALHSAAKAGNLKVLEWLCSNVTSGFLEIQNDFGFTPL
jgi:ankyrin repeat protein